MKKMLLALAIAATALAACDDFSRPSPAEEAPVVEAPVAPAAEDTAVPAAAPAATDTPPPVDTIPPGERTSEQSVQPESETLFY